MKQVWLLALAGLLASCSVARHLPPGERLYAGADFRFESDSLVTNCLLYTSPSPRD